MKAAAIILLALAAPLAQAATPIELLTAYRAEAVRSTPGYQPSAEAGRRLYHHRFGVSEQMPACASCHTDNPADAGRHAVTNKAIQPLAPVANAERFTDPAKVEKWFRRNCTEVVGRACSAAEKADFIAFVMGVR
jgi:mono/diheme cytochrome c family protein